MEQFIMQLIFQLVKLMQLKNFIKNLKTLKNILVQMKQNFQLNTNIKILLLQKKLIYIIKILLEKEELYLIFEKMQQNLYQFYYKQKKKKRQIPESMIANIIRQILEGIDFMHSIGYFHRDLKPENILISKDNVKICDFGQIKSINAKPPYTEYTSTRWYRSPEQLLDQGQYNYPVDIFAIGAIMAELYLMKPIFQGKTQIDQLNQICQILGQPQDMMGINIKSSFYNSQQVPLENMIRNACPEAIDLMSNIFQHDPYIRPNAKDLLKHEYFKKFQKYDDTNKSKTIFKISVKQKAQVQHGDDFTDEQIKLLSMSLEPKHKQLIIYKNNIEKPKLNIFQQENQIVNNQNLYNSKFFAHKQNIFQKEKPNIIFPKILKKSKKDY